MPNIVGGWDISELKEVKLPQKAQSAFDAIMNGLVGAEYIPLLYVGSQLVNGTNYCIIALQTIVCANPMKRLVKMVINEKNGQASIVSINRIIKF